MLEGDIILVGLPQSDGSNKLRPALILKKLPKYNDYLVCGISTQINQHIKDIDIILDDQSDYFHKTGLHKTSLIRLLFLAVIQNERIAGKIGKIQPAIHKDLLHRLAKFLSS